MVTVKKTQKKSSRKEKKAAIQAKRTEIRKGTPVILTDGSLAQKEVLVFEILAFFLGILGVHNFYLGRKWRGAVQLVLTLLSPVLLIIPLVAVYTWVFFEMCLVKQDVNGVPLRPFKAMRVVFSIWQGFIGLVVLAVLVIGFIAGFKIATQRYEANRIAYEVDLLSQNVRALYQDKDSFEGLNTQALIDQNVLSSSQNVYGGDTLVYPVSLQKESDGFVIYQDGVPPKMGCSTLLSSPFWGHPKAKLAGIIINAEQYTVTSFPINEMAAKSICRTVAADSDQPMKFYWIYHTMTEGN